MPIYKITMTFGLEADSALDAFSYSADLQIVDADDAAIPAESCTTKVEFGVEEEIEAQAAPDGDLPDNVRSIH